jgi:gamma-glutamyl hercynylcysteine S-oxide hydrolase
MCRHLAYLGTPTPLSDLLFDAPHSLAHQAERPRLQTSGTTNPDGWGVTWYPDGAGTPEQYRTVTPIWDDAGFSERAHGITSRAFLAAARLASPGATLVDTGNAPFLSGPWSFSLNGIVDRFPDGIGDDLRADLRPDRQGGIVGDADTEVLFAMVLQHLDHGIDPAGALAKVVRRVLAVTTGRLNLLLTDGHRLYATRWGNSLFRLGPVVASEPTDDRPDWTEIPDRSLLVVADDSVTISSLSP